MSESGVIPRPEDRHTLTDWHIEGEIRCPDCFRHFTVNGALEDLVKFTVTHESTCPADMPP